MRKTWRSLALAAVVWGGASCGVPVLAAEPEPIVVGMSFAQLKAEGRELRARTGVVAYIGRINSAGGIHGRKIVLETLDDGGHPERIVQNVRTLVNDHKAVAIVGCLSDAACQTMADAANELKVPLVGAMSGLTRLSRSHYPYLFRLRADYAREVEAIVTQMVQMGQSRVAVLSDGSNAAELDQLLQDAMARKSISFDLLKVGSTQPAELAQIVSKLGTRYNAAVLNISTETVEAFIDQGLSERPEWPRVLMTLATGNLTSLIGHFRGRVVGFSMLVPDPGSLRTSIARDLNRDADEFGSAWGVTFDGMEAYLGMKLVVEALRRTGRQVNARQLADVLEAADGWELSGFRVSFSKSRSTGSDWVEMGLRSAQGVLVR